MDEDSLELLDQHRTGDPDAAEKIFRRFIVRLIGLVRTMLSSKLNPRFDAEDVTQSAFRSFFRCLSTDQFVFEKSGQLWKLLAAIAVNKSRRQIEFHTAAMRSVNWEHQPDHSAFEYDPASFTGEPRPEEAMELSEELEVLLTNLKLPVHREMVEFRLTGHDVEEISELTKRSERSVRRVLKLFRRDLERRLQSIEPE